MSWFLHFLFFVSALIFLYYLYFVRISRFWGKLRVPHTEAWFPLGDFQRGGWSKNLGLLIRDLYNQFAGERFFGVWFFTNPVLVVRDPELIRSIFVKDFMYFHDRGMYYNEKDEPLSAHLFAIDGLKWKNIRAKLSPTFTSGKIKMMFPLLTKCSEELERYLKGPAERQETIDMREVAAMFMTDVISICAFGIETNSLKHPDAEFREMGKKFQEPSLRTFILFYLQFSAPKLVELLKLRILPKEPGDFFLRAIKEVMDHREKTKIVRNDFMQLLMQLKNDGRIHDDENQTSNDKVAEVGEKLTFEEAAAQALVFFIGGFETSASTTAFALYELAKNQEIQEKLRNEISKSLEKHGGKLSYEFTLDIPYLDKVIDETLRKYPIVPTLTRESSKEYRIPDSDVIIPKGVLVHIPIYGLHMDEKYFPDPEKFDPERFSEENKQKIHNYSYLPFGEGPRNCIGKRFGLLQVKVALIVMLRKFKFELPEELKNRPLTFDPRSFVLIQKGGMNIKITSV